MRAEYHDSQPIQAASEADWSQEPTFHGHLLCPSLLQRWYDESSRIEALRLARPSSGPRHQRMASLNSQSSPSVAAGQEGKDKVEPGPLAEKSRAQLEVLSSLIRSDGHPLFVLALATLSEDAGMRGLLLSTDACTDLFQFIRQHPSPEAGRALSNLTELLDLAPLSPTALAQLQALGPHLLALLLENTIESPASVKYLVRCLANMGLHPEVRAAVRGQFSAQQFADLERGLGGDPEGIQELDRLMRIYGLYSLSPQYRALAGTPRRGLRVLALDGGGIKALVSLEILREIETRVGQPLTEMFDLVCGTSTGAVLSGLIAIRKNNLVTCADLYRDLARKVFTSTGAVSEGESSDPSSPWARLIGYTNMMKTGAFYRSKPLVAVLKQLFGEDRRMIDTSLTGALPCFFVSTLCHMLPPRPFIWRNYNLPADRASRYEGSSTEHTYAGLRASTAAPTFFDPYVNPNRPQERHLDGALYANNPTAVALHEVRALFGHDVPIDCIVSVGTGEPAEKPSGKGFGALMATLARSAISVEKTDEALEDCLREASIPYFRFDPVAAELDFSIDETREEILGIMTEVTRAYIQKQVAEFDRLEHLFQTLNAK